MSAATSHWLAHAAIAVALITLVILAPAIWRTIRPLFKYRCPHGDPKCTWGQCDGCFWDRQW